MGQPCKLRPHIKTHKLPLIAHKQVEAGAIGITCAKLGEAKIFLEAGIKDVLIANEIVGATKIERLVNLSAYGNLICAVDHYRKCEGYLRGCRKNREKDQCPRGGQCGIKSVRSHARETGPGICSKNGWI